MLIALLVFVTVADGKALQTLRQVFPMFVHVCLDVQ